MQYLVDLVNGGRHAIKAFLESILARLFHFLERLFGQPSSLARVLELVFSFGELL